MTAGPGTARRRDPVGIPDCAATVLAPVTDAAVRGDLERPEAAVAAVLEELREPVGHPAASVVPVRRVPQASGYGPAGRTGDVLDAGALVDVAAALAARPPGVVHAVGWEAGVVAAAVRSGAAAPRADRPPPLLLEPLGVPGNAERALAEHLSLLVVSSESHRRVCLRAGLAAELVRVVPPAGPRGPADLVRDEAGRAAPNPVVAVLGDGVGPVTLALLEAVLHRCRQLHVLFAGSAARALRARRNATVVRSWPESLSARVHGAARVGWPLLARVDAVLDASTTSVLPSAALAAAATARPVLALPDSPAAEVVADGITGRALVGTDPARLADVVAGTLGDRALVRRMGAAAFEHWSAEHSPRVRASRLRALHAELAPD